MSRIEKAIEVAIQKRDKKTSAQPEVSLKQSNILTKGEKTSKVQNLDSIKISNPYLVTISDKTSPAAEQYRKLKSLLVKLEQVGNHDKALMITSSVAQEGKSITALNLAITLAEDYDQTVLLVEADIRKPSILSYLGIKNDVGLTDCVQKGIDVADVLIKTGIGSLTVLPAGKKVENPVELFSSNRMKTIINEVKSRYKDRYIIVDTTPLLPFAEPQYIANMVGSVLLVAREGITQPDKLKKSIEMLKNNNLLGVVSNGVSSLSKMKSYYGYYK